MSDWERLAQTGCGRPAYALASEMRKYFEANRPLTLWERLFGRRPYVESITDDDLMLGLLMIAWGAEP